MLRPRRNPSGATAPVPHVGGEYGSGEPAFPEAIRRSAGRNFPQLFNSEIRTRKRKKRKEQSIADDSGYLGDLLFKSDASTESRLG